MKVSIEWLKEYVDVNISPEEYAHAMTMSGSKVESIHYANAEIKGVVAGRVLSISKHPSGEKLSVAVIDAGRPGEVIKVVTGASNVKAGDTVPVALDGASLPGGKQISGTIFRGVESAGMLCSLKELGLDPEDYNEAVEDGIFILNDAGITAVPGADIIQVLSIGDEDVVIEFEITPNRPDCLCMIGIARETAATLGGNNTADKCESSDESSNAGGRKLRWPDLKPQETGIIPASECAKVEILAPDLCPRYAARIIKDVVIKPSPSWMKKRLKAAGVRSINNIVDITNYVMFELGQPMHAFDLDKLEDRQIIVRRAGEGEVMATLDGQDRKLDPSMLVIADGTKAVAVAGVMGGAYSEVTENTRTLLLESATFNKTSIRLTAKKLGMRTEASGRFEKGLDPENTITALERAAVLIEMTDSGKVLPGIIDCCPVKLEKRTLVMNPQKINNLLGTNISDEEMLNILRKLEFKTAKKQESSGYLIEIPTFRGDVYREADIAEEIARFYGYNNIEGTLLEGRAPTAGGKSIKQKNEEIVRNAMISSGFSEAYTYSFTSPNVFDKLRLPENSQLRDTVKIFNPLGEDYSIMRTTTLPDMLASLSRNYNRKSGVARLFEMSFTYHPAQTLLPSEHPVLTFGMFGNGDFYDLKGAVANLFDVLGINGIRYEKEEEHPAFHRGRTARILFDGKNIGIFGEIHPDVAKEFEGPVRIYAGYIDWFAGDGTNLLDTDYRSTLRHIPLPRHPASLRDLALVMDEDVLAGDIGEAIRKTVGSLLESVALFDVFKGKQLGEGKKSLAYSLTFRAPDRTLVDEEVNIKIAEILKNLKENYDIHLRE